MKLLLILLGAVILLGGAGYNYVRTHPDALLVKQVRELPQQVGGIVQGAKERFFPHGTPAFKPKTIHAPKAPSPSKPDTSDVSTPAAKPPPQNQVTRYLKNGGVVTGELVHETPSGVVLRFEYGDVGFKRDEVARLVKGQQETDDDGVTMPWEGEHKKARWDYHHDVVVKLMKGTVVDAMLTQVLPDALILTQTLEGGGQIEHTIKRSDVEGLLFRPVKNERSAQIEETLKTVFPTMHWYEEGIFTIVTDSIPPIVKEYRQTIRELATEWYLTFYPLVKDRSPKVQHYIVVFDDWPSYIDYAASDGIRGWLTVGYFSPTDEVLYCFNMVGELFSGLLEEAYLGDLRRSRDEISGQIKGFRYAEFIEGQMSEVVQLYERLHGTLRQMYRQESVEVLRHELTHGMFHNWGVQGIVLSQMPDTNAEEAKTKRQYLESKDLKEKRSLLQDLISQKSAEGLPEMQAANSWYVEGLAGYMQPTPVGELLHSRLFTLQEAQRNNELLPLEFLHAFEIGSFRGMTSPSKLKAYSQAWALSHFLMHRYYDGFMRYLDRLAREKPQEGDDTLQWLLDLLGKELRPLEQEFVEYIRQFPPEESEELKDWQLFYDHYRELEALIQRLWGS